MGSAMPPEGFVLPLLLHPRATEIPATELSVGGLTASRVLGEVDDEGPKESEGKCSDGEGESDVTFLGSLVASF